MLWKSKDAWATAQDAMREEPGALCNSVLVEQEVGAGLADLSSVGEANNLTCGERIVKKEALLVTMLVPAQEAS